MAEISVSYREQFGKRQIIAGKGCRPTCLNFVHLSKGFFFIGTKNRKEKGGLLSVILFTTLLMVCNDGEKGVAEAEED